MSLGYPEKDLIKNNCLPGELELLSSESRNVYIMCRHLHAVFFCPKRKMTRGKTDIGSWSSKLLCHKKNRGTIHGHSLCIGIITLMDDAYVICTFNSAFVTGQLPKEMTLIWFPGNWQEAWEKTQPWSSFSSWNHGYYST